MTQTAAIPQFHNAYTHLSDKEAQYINQMTISDLEAIRLVLEGNSVIDWFRLDFSSDEQIEIFLRVNGYDITQIHDIKRIDRLRREAIAYLDLNYPHRLPPELRENDIPIQKLFYWASGSYKRSKIQMFACMVLKIMHTLNHIDARELMHSCEFRASELYTAVERKVEDAIVTMQNEGFHIVDFYGSHKDKFSMVTKLISKKENHAAAIYDKIRFRIITLTVSDILPMLYYLGRTICPFNYVIPGSSHNSLIPYSDLLLHFSRFEHYAAYLRKTASLDDCVKNHPNQFSDPGYKVINIVSDVPIRVDELLYTPDFAELGRIIFVPVEFQIMDQETYHSNEAGNSNHKKYKQRQSEAVNIRLGIHLTDNA